MTPEGLKLQDFCDTRDLHSLVERSTCCKGINATCSDLF